MLLLRVRTLQSASVRASPDEAYALLVDVERVALHLPDLESLTPTDGGYVWRLARIGTRQVSVHTVYGCRYECDPRARTVRWSPLEGVGNARLSGQWTVTPEGGGARIAVDSELELTLPLPRLVRPLAQPLAERENARVVRDYLRNLAETLSGGDGRLRRHASRGCADRA